MEPALALQAHPTVEEIFEELLDGLRKAATLTEVNLAAGRAHQELQQMMTPFGV